MNKLGLEFVRRFNLSKILKLKNIFKQFCDVFASRSLQTLLTCENINVLAVKTQNEEFDDSLGIFVASGRANIKSILRAGFKFIPVQPHLDEAIKIMRMSTLDYRKIESCLFFISSMITGIPLPEAFHDVMEIVLKISPESPSFLIETACRFLKDIIDHSDYHKTFYGLPALDFDSIYKFLAQVPGPASELVTYEKFWDEYIGWYMYKIDFLNHILLKCQEPDDIKIICQAMKSVLIDHLGDHNFDLHFKYIVKFYSKQLIQVSFD
ncbi:hypothetical protein RF11_03534 [Thelohanellus kitauei]|uniref:Uncharacterized protein n=1 Tax=Thelohanellus kitauei TaxID=669202 RepID=A0A0C2MYK6_THEKT|nr:hypothetical protein RF11_03533 [Thelohanellus kitauei]KII66713.1 hypothetical protein RF11_03534 [Thelohanellus kitauei]